MSATLTEVVGIVTDFIAVFMEPPLVYFTALSVIGGVAVLVRRLIRK